MIENIVGRRIIEQSVNFALHPNVTKKTIKVLRIVLIKMIFERRKRKRKEIVRITSKPRFPLFLITF